MRNQRLRGGGSRNGNGCDSGSGGHRRRHVNRSNSGGGDRDGSGVGRRKDHLSPGGSGRLGNRHSNRLSSRLNNRLRAGNTLILIVGTSTEADTGAARDANIVAGTSVVLAARARATGSVVLVVDASAIADSRTTGNTDIETGTSIVLAVAGGGRSVSGGATKKRKAVLESDVSSGVQCSMRGVLRNLPVEEQRRQKRGQWPERGTERPRWRKCWKALYMLEFRARRNGPGEILKSGY